MKIMQHFAEMNRKAMIETISIGLHIKERDIIERFTTIHNYIYIPDAENPENIATMNMFGRPLITMLNDGIASKLQGLPDVSKQKLQKALKIVCPFEMIKF